MHSQQNDNDHIPVMIVGWCQAIKKGPHELTVHISRNGGNADCYTGWHNQDYMEVWEPTKDEQKMLYYSQRMNTDNGVDQTHSYLDYTFTKRSEKSVMRLMYYDNLRVIGSGKWCRWEMKVDDKSCPAPIAGSLHTSSGDNDHYPHIFMGECPGLKKGTRKIKIAITRSSGADCYTGWSPGPKVQHVLIEAQEGCANIVGCAVRGSCDIGKEQCVKCRSGYLLIHGTVDTCKMPPGKAAKFPAARLTAKNDNYGGDQVDEIPMRKLVFTKQSDTTLMKLTYADNFRVHGSGKACYWRIRVDGRNCPVDIWNGKHSGHSSDNDYTPHAIIGTCSKLAAGAHTMTIQLWRGGGSDCYTWGRQVGQETLFTWRRRRSIRKVNSRAGCSPWATMAAMAALSVESISHLTSAKTIPNSVSLGPRTFVSEHTTTKVAFTAIGNSGLTGGHARRQPRSEQVCTAKITTTTTSRSVS